MMIRTLKKLYYSSLKNIKERRTAIKRTGLLPHWVPSATGDIDYLPGTQGLRFSQVPTNTFLPFKKSFLVTSQTGMAEVMSVSSAQYGMVYRCSKTRRGLARIPYITRQVAVRISNLVPCRCDDDGKSTTSSCWSYLNVGELGHCSHRSSIVTRDVTHSVLLTEPPRI